MAIMAFNPFHLLKPNIFRLPQPILLPQPIRASVLQTLPKTLAIFSTLSSTSLSPPSSREEAITQAKLCLSSTLQKPLNNPLQISTRKLKKQRQPRFRIEIPIADDDSPSSLTLLAAELFASLSINKKGSSPNLLLVWSSPDLLEPASTAFGSATSVIHSDIALVSEGDLSSADLAVFLSPEAVMLKEIRMLANILSPKPVVLFNPGWRFEEEKDFDPQVRSFVGTFDVVYSFMGLEVRGVLRRRKGVVFKWVKDGVTSGEGWVVMVEAEGKKKGELKVISRFKQRPTIGEVENLLYNLMAANSPVTKSVKFLRNLASNIAAKNK